MTVSDGLLAADTVEQSFGGVRALDGVSLSLVPREVVGLIGPNGSGKTTLLNAISGVHPPTSGKIHLDGQDVTGRSPDRMCDAGVARTFQHIRLFAGLTVQENLEVGLRDLPGRHRVAAAQELLEEQRLLEDANRWAGTLAYAQQRRLELARALATRPRFLLLDEPAAGMNRSESEDLLATIRNLPERYGVGVLVIDHDLHLITHLCTRIAVLNEGVKIAEGTPPEIQANEAVIGAYLGHTPSDSPTTTTTTEV
jgi:branched-chain amino acid transport system permease protein